MDITVTKEQGRVPVTVMHLNGSLDASSYQLLVDRARQEIAGGSGHLLLDLAQVPYMSSAGLRALNTLYQQLAAASSSPSGAELLSGKSKSPYLKLLSPAPRVLQVLQMAGDDLFLEIHHNVREAVDSF